MEKIINKAIQKHKEALSLLENNKKVLEDIAALFISTLKNKKKIIFMGNGGSAADAQHLAAELVGRFKVNRRALAAIALSTNTSIITAVANDFSFDEIFSRQIEALGQPKDLVVAISTSGQSKNVVTAVKKAKDMGLVTVGFLGKDGGQLSAMVDSALIVPSADTASIQEMHILAGHIICDIVETRLAAK